MQGHASAPETLYHDLSSSSGGLSSQEAESRLKKYGENILTASGGITPAELFLAQFKNVLIIILLCATVLSLFLGHYAESFAILAIVFFAVLLGFWQELRAERAIEALKKMAAPVARVLRDGREVTLPARLLVPGDIVLVAAGDTVPADIRLVSQAHLRCDEAPLTGESLPVEKDASVILPEPHPLAERINCLYAGTNVVYGRGSGIVMATGMSTEVGKIADLLQGVQEEPTPLQKSLDRTGKQLAKATLVMVALIMAFGIYRGEPFVSMLLFAVALGVAVVPEALPAVVTISLALGVQRMVKKHALMRRLPAVEVLGSTTVICTDKTGTLTKDEMTIRRLHTGWVDIQVSGTGYTPSGHFTADEDVPHVMQEMLKVSVLCNDAKLFLDETGTWQMHGDPTEGAFLVTALKAGLEIDTILALNPRLDEVPFSPESRRMTTLHRGGGRSFVCVKGAPEVIIPRCSRIRMGSGEDNALKPFEQHQLLAVADSMAKDALRVIAVAVKDASRCEDAEDGLVFLGLAGMMDPPRDEVYEAVRTCRQAGIRPVMITGDNPVTARAIAYELGIMQGGRVVTGADLDGLSASELVTVSRETEVFARVSPHHKLLIVEALQQAGEVVAMTGDGVNDAPALKKADIGISMGIKGTDVAKEASAMMLTDDNFASIVKAVEEGRGIYDNIRKYLTFLLSSNIGEIGLMGGAVFMGLPLPLSAVQILYVNLLTDGLPALALAVDPAEKSIMQRPPRKSGGGMFTRPVLGLMLAGGVWSTLINLLLFTGCLAVGVPAGEAMTMTFVSLVLVQFFKAYSFRTFSHSIFIGTFANRWLNRAILAEVILLMAVVMVPQLHGPFGTYTLSGVEWLVVVTLAATIVPVLEVVKKIMKTAE